MREIIASVLLSLLLAGCGSAGVPRQERTMEVTVLVPADARAYGEMITGEQNLQRAAAMPFVEKRVVVPYSRDLLRASADAAAREVGSTQMGPAAVLYWKIKDGTAFVLLNVDTDGWAGVSFTRAYSHGLVEKTLLQFKEIKRVVWDEAPGEHQAR